MHVLQLALMKLFVAKCLQYFSSLYLKVLILNILYLYLELVLMLVPRDFINYCCNILKF